MPARSPAAVQCGAHQIGDESPRIAGMIVAHAASRRPRVPTAGRRLRVQADPAIEPRRDGDAQQDGGRAVTEPGVGDGLRLERAADLHQVRRAAAGV